MYSLFALMICMTSWCLSSEFCGMRWMLKEKVLRRPNRWIGVLLLMMMSVMNDFIAECVGSSCEITMPRIGGMYCVLMFPCDRTSFVAMKFAVWHLLLGLGKSCGNWFLNCVVMARCMMYPRCRRLSVLVFCLSPRMNLG